MKTKELDLLLLLFQNQETFMTGKELSQQLLLSERTIRTYIPSLQTIVAKNGAQIIAKQGYGYKLHMLRAMQFEMFLNKNRLRVVGENKNDKILESALDRQNYLLNKLLIEDRAIYLDTMADELFISRSTLSKEMSVIKKLIAPYHLQIVSKVNSGTYVQGEESNKRSFIMQYFFKGVRFNSIQDYMNHTSYFDDIPKENFIMIILEECRKHQIKLSDVMVQNILMHLILSVKRVEKGLELKYFELDSAFSTSIEYKCAQQMIARLKQECNLHFPQEEIAYLTLHLGAKNNRPLNENVIEVSDLSNELHTILTMMQEQIKLPLSEDTLFKNCLLEHLRPMLIRIQKGIVLENPLTKEIMRDHKDVYELCTHYMKQMPCLATYEISQDEWAYLTLHFMAAMERMQQKAKVQALVICSTGCGSAQLLKSRIEKEFKEEIYIVSELGYYEMNETHLQGVDIIISSVDLDSVIFNVPVINVSIFLNENDIKAIHNAIQKTTLEKQFCCGLSNDHLSLIQKQEVFNAYIKKSHFQIFEGRPSVETILHVLLQRLSLQEKDNYQKRMVDQIRLRESMGSFLFSDTIAVPHPAIPIGENAAIAVGIIKEGVAWNKEHPTIRFVFLLSPSFLGNQGLKTMTNAIIKLIEHPHLQEQLLQCSSFAQFSSLFLNLM